jgi:hypothetical protein
MQVAPGQATKVDEVDDAGKCSSLFWRVFPILWPFQPGAEYWLGRDRLILTLTNM